MLSHLASRKFNPSLYSNVCVDNENRVMTVYMYTDTGICKGYQQYRPDADKLAKNSPRDGRYFTWVTDGYFASWGAETMIYRPDVVIIVEGIFDACRLHNFGIPALATFGSYNTQFKNYLACLSRSVYTINDRNGVNSKFKCFKNLEIPNHRNDVGECSDTELLQLLTKEGLLNDSYVKNIYVQNNLHLVVLCVANFRCGCFGCCWLGIIHFAYNSVTRKGYGCCHCSLSVIIIATNCVDFWHSVH